VAKPRTRHRRHWPVVLAALVLALGAATASAVGLTANAGLKPAAAPAAAPAATASATAKSQVAPGAHAMKFGLDYAGTLLDDTPAQVRSSLQDAVAVGAKWIRIDLPWETVQPDDSAGYDWSGFDTIAKSARALGLSIDAILDSTAYWDTSHACKVSGINTEFCPPADVADFAHFAAAAAQRYQGEGVDAWEIWNEPNIGQRWWPTPSATGYAQMLSAVSQAIRGVDPHAYIVMGGLAVEPDDAATHVVSQNTFLTDMVRIKGALADVDAIGYHPFSGATPPSAAGDFKDVSTSQGNLLSILQANGYPNVKIWLTETGYSVGGAGAAATVLEAQAAYAADLVKTVAANPNVAADFWFADQDIDAQRLWWGLRDGGGGARPSFTTLKTAIAACGCSID
jgi:hypothetical protein